MDGKSHSTDRRANARRGPADDGPEPDGAMPASIFRSRGRTRAGSRLKIGSFQFHSIPHRMASANFPHDPPFERTQFSMNDVMDPPGRLQYYIYRWAFALSLAMLPVYPLSLMKMYAYKDQQTRGAWQKWLRIWPGWFLGQSRARAHHELQTRIMNNGVDAFALNTLLAHLAHLHRFAVQWLTKRGVSIPCQMHRHCAHFAI